MIQFFLTNFSVESIPSSLDQGSSFGECSIGLNETDQSELGVSSASVARSSSSVSGTSFGSSDSEGFHKPIFNKERRSGIYEKPLTNACEDEPDSGTSFQTSLIN